MTFSVYIGFNNKNDRVVRYVGITSQIPRRRFSWHKSNGKALYFVVQSEHKTRTEAAKEEQRLIDLHHPTINKRGMALPVSHLSPEEIEIRKSNPKWCSNCLRRRVNKGYKICLWCERLAKENKS